jgi:hypothetical protein
MDSRDGRPVLAINQVGIKRDWASVDIRLRRQRTVKRIGLLGARIICELLGALDCYHNLGADLESRLASCAELDPEILRALAGDQFAQVPLRVVGRS